jgi:hypothetical protein
VSWYDKIPAPKKRCENCANGTMHVTEHGSEWKDVYRCALDQGLKDYRVCCDNYERRASIKPVREP